MGICSTISLLHRWGPDKGYLFQRTGISINTVFHLVFFIYLVFKQCVHLFCALIPIYIHVHVSHYQNTMFQLILQIMSSLKICKVELMCLYCYLQTRIKYNGQAGIEITK